MMTTSKINEVIATSLGYSIKRDGDYFYPASPDGQRLGVISRFNDESFALAALKVHTPDYTSDLNACAVFEATLNDEQKKLYVARLSDAIIGGYVNWLNSPLSSVRMAVFSTALQRCEAYLRTLGLWEEG